MNKLVIIPIYNFFDLTEQIIDLYNLYLDEAHIVIVDDSTKDIFEYHKSRIGSPLNRVVVIKNSISGDLRNAFHQGLTFMEKEHGVRYDCVITNEHDVIPNVDTLYACLSVFENREAMRGIASVSTVYKWKGKDCYPTHPDWYNGWTVLNGYGVGECKVIGAQGIPFGFALWKPDALRLISDSSLPKIWKLDSKFGEKLHKNGYYHLRLVDYYVEHYNNGVKSWKTA